MTHKFKPGDMVVLRSLEYIKNPEYPYPEYEGTATLPIAVRTDNGFKTIIESPVYQGILSGRRMYLYLPRHSTYGLVLCYEHDDYVLLDGDEPIIRDHRVFIMISINGEPEYVRVMEMELGSLHDEQI